MINYREIIRLKSMDYSQRQISKSVHSSRDTIREVLKLAETNGLTWPLDEALTNEELLFLFYPERRNRFEKVEPDTAHIHKELARPGVNLSLLWTEYCDRCYSSGQIPYMYSQFCEKYRVWARKTKATMRINHKPGDTMEVDWAGTTIPITDSVTGEITPAYLFVSALPCSGYAYAEPCMDMKSETWILCHVNAYEYIGGVTRILIPDNLKTGIISNTRYDTIINKSYHEMAEYYGTAIVPARVTHPKDKPMAEGTVKFASTWIIAALRDRKFFSIQEARDAVKEKLNELNNYPFKKREGSRSTAFINEEKDFMLPLPISKYEPAVWSTATIHNDYLISDDKNKYSVPFDVIGEVVDVRLTKATVEVFLGGSRIASHQRHEKAQRNPVVLPEHMPENHRRYLSYNEDDFKSWGESIGVNTFAVVTSFLSQGKVVEQGYKPCASLTRLADKYGHEQLEIACGRVLVYSSAPTIRTISTILKKRPR